MQGKQKQARQLNCWKQIDSYLYQFNSKRLSQWVRIVWCVLVKIVSIVIVLLMFRIASVEYMRDNIVMLDLFYNKMSFEKITEEPAIDELSLICKLISQLWIGLVVSARYSLCKVFSHGYSFNVYIESPNPKKPRRPYTTGLKPHQLKSPTSKPQPPNHHILEKMRKKYKE